MKKQNNRFRNGNNNNGYTLNYKFDSVSIAGKISGTALDLIRRYNDLAKEAQSCGDYVEMEIYRQYAEHYRKIVTDINERRQNNRQENQNKAEDNAAENTPAEENTTDTSVENKETEQQEAKPSENGYVETLPAPETKKTLHVVEIKEETEKTVEKPKRVYRRKTTTAKTSE